jgi:hypothetical protein
MLMDAGFTDVTIDTRFGAIHRAQRRDPPLLPKSHFSSPMGAGRLSAQAAAIGQRPK